MWGKRREELGRALRRSSEAPVEGKPIAAARVHLDDDEIAELDRFGAWWAPDERGPGLGQRIRIAIERGEPQSFASAEDRCARVGGPDPCGCRSDAGSLARAEGSELGR